MTEQYDSLNEKTKQLDIAMKYTKGDVLKAKEMTSGQYLDVIVIKGKFIVEKKGLSGSFLAFINYIQEYIANISTIISSKPLLFEKTRIFDNWKAIYKDLLAVQGGPDMIDSQNFSYFLIDSFVGYDIFPDVQEKNLDNLTRTVTEIIAKSFNASAVRCQLDVEDTSSLELEMNGVKIYSPDGDRGEAVEPLIKEDERITKIESEAKYIVEGKSVLSPLHGKNAADLIPGDKIKLSLPGKDVVSEKVLRLLNAYDGEGAAQPINGRVKARIPMEKSGYIIYAFVAKGVLAKIIEEENVKIMIDSPAEEAREEPGRFENRLIYLMGILLGLIILCAIILFQFM